MTTRWALSSPQFNEELASELETTPGLARGTADDVFAALDGHELTLGGQRRTMAVFGIHDGADARWMQVGLVGDPGYPMLVVLVQIHSRIEAADLIRVAVEDQRRTIARKVR